MSFEVYLQAFRAGQPAGIAADAIRRAFAGHLVELEEDFWQARYDGEVSSDLLLQALPADPTLIHTISVYRPCADPRLWTAVFALLDQPGTLLWHHGGAAPLARDPAIAAALPPDLLAALGPPVVAMQATQLVPDIDSE